MHGSQEAGPWLGVLGLLPGTVGCLSPGAAEASSAPKAPLTTAQYLLAAYLRKVLERRLTDGEEGSMLLGTMLSMMATRFSTQDFCV